MKNLQQPITIKLKTEEIQRYFDLDSDDFDVTCIIEELKDSLKLVTSHLKDCSTEYCGQAKNDFFYFSQLSINDYCLELAQDFTNQLGYDYLDENSKQYQHYLALQTGLRSVVEDYRLFAANNMNDIMFSNTGSYPDTKDYRRCPHCNLIWYRVTACPNVTCGNIETEKDIVSSFKSFLKFSFKWRKGQKPIIEYQTKDKVYNFNSRKGDNGKRLGCGKSFDWMGQKPVDMKDFFEVEATDVKVIKEDLEKDAIGDMEEERKKVQINVIKK